MKSLDNQVICGENVGQVNAFSPVAEQLPRGKEVKISLFPKRLSSKGIKKTIKEYERLLKVRPEDLKARLRLADLYIKAGDKDRATGELLEIAQQYLKQEMDLKAISIYKKILVLNPDYLDVYYKLGDLYMKRGLLGEAKIQYKKVLERAPHEYRAEEKIRKIEKKEKERRSKGEEVEGKKAIMKDLMKEIEEQLSVQVEKDDYQTHYNLGVAFMEMGLYEKAIDEFKIVMNDPSLEFDSYLMLGVCYREKGEPEKGIPFLQKALLIRGLPEKRYAEVYNQLGKTYERMGEVDKAREAYGKGAGEATQRT